ncbi:MAG: hypothetical protein J0L50_10335, partial [Sphingomonadales bacterium]|nr:hypothetical protein [Sphingomonadales bacterium]
VHANSPAKIGIQLAHAGRKGSTKKLWEGIDQPLDSGNWPLIAASALPYKPGSQTPREMTRADMDRVRDDFVRATTMADQAGFDLIELHCAHGYLLASFVSPLTNRRADEYGSGSTPGHALASARRLRHACSKPGLPFGSADRGRAFGRAGRSSGTCRIRLVLAVAGWRRGAACRAVRGLVVAQAPGRGTAGHHLRTARGG